MKRPLRTLRLAVPAALVLGAAALVQATRPAGEPAGADGPVVVPFVVEAVRELVLVDAQVLVATPGAAGDEMIVEGVRVLSQDGPLVELAPGRRLLGDPRYGRVQSLVERMPHSHMERDRAFAPADPPELHGDEALRAEGEIKALLAEMRADYDAGRPEPFVHVNFRLPLDQVFHGTDPAGTRRVLDVEVATRTAAGPRLTTVPVEIEKLAPILGPPAEMIAAGTSLVSGDLHVHSCHGEAVGACAPSGNCAAETLQTSGSFTYAQLKTQYQAIGVSWFTATDHSYCIDSPGEYAAIVGECAALTDGSFLVVPDIELSSDEVGPQTGSDIGDLACVGTTTANHMGAHGISGWISGGTEGFLGFCDGLFSDVLAPFTTNVQTIRSQGGYPIINHPVDGSSWGWNSKAVTVGIEANGMHGVEIWNGGSQTGQGSHVGDWVDWMLGGRILYAYSGSDTHDSVSPFGLNNVLLDGPFTIDGLEAALKAGRIFISEGHFLTLECRVGANPVAVPMGTLQALSPSQPATTVSVDVPYDFGGDTSTLTIFKGRVGDASETVLCSQAGLSGAGTFTCVDTLDTVGRTWYRAYAEGSGQTAYTNPVFFLPGSCSYTTYGTGLGGANIATLSSVSNPSIGSTNTLDVTGFSGASPFAVFALSPTQVPGGSPFFGGFLLIGMDFVLSGTSALAGGAGSFTFSIPYEPGFVGGSLYCQAGTLDPGQPGGFALSNGLAMTICGLLQ